ncbi:MAG: hypothetical protein U9O56_00550 [Campylobacterota bacterium]|nr:hypothetical protein [Campylobacterota bacterium]
MKIKNKVLRLRDNITENIDYLSKEYQTTYDILDELNKIIKFDMSHSLIFQWWVENEDSINIINELIEKLEEI